MRKNNIIYIIIISIIIIISMLAWSNYQARKKNKQISDYLETIDKIEREFIENIPIYEDHFSPAKEKKLRKYLLIKHLKIAENKKLKPIKQDDDLYTSAGSGELVKLLAGPDELYYFYNVPEKYRYLTPNAASGLKKLTKRFQDNIKKRKDLPAVKVAISSAIRPVEYQKNLLKKNINASIISSHKYGLSFDVFYDDYYISLPEQETDNERTRILLEKIRRKFGFLMGDSLRRQFRSILAETLLQLQDEKILYVIHEKYQRCYHVTILK